MNNCCSAAKYKHCAIDDACKEDTESVFAQLISLDHVSLVNALRHDLDLAVWFSDEQCPRFPTYAFLYKKDKSVPMGKLWERYYGSPPVRSTTSREKR